MNVVPEVAVTERCDPHDVDYDTDSSETEYPQTDQTELLEHLPTEDREEEVPSTQATFSIRQLTYRFLNLDFPVQMRIVVELDLLAAEDHGIERIELFQRVFRRAKEHGQLPDLWSKTVEQPSTIQTGE
jgi:hypothetical protein